MTDLALTKLSETASTITLGWTPPAGAQGYLFWADAKRSSTLDGTRSSVKFAKGAAKYRVQALVVFAEGSYPPAVTPPPPPPPTGRPASYTTGPLGTSNFVPAQGKSFLIEYPGGPGQTWATMQARVQMLEQGMGRKFDGFHTEYYWQKGSLQPNERSDQRLEWAHGRGQIPCLSAHVEYSIAETNSGAADATWNATATYLKGLGFPVMMRLWWEFDGTAGFPWSVGQSANIGAPFVTAWKRVVGIFKAQGANNVGFWWCPLEGSPDRQGINASYPGDAYVDWVGSDVYNGGDGSWNTPLHGDWASFQDCALYPNPPVGSQYSLWSGKKPFVIGELGCTKDATRQGDWFRAIPAALKTAPNLCGLSFFDQDVSGIEGSVANWLVDSSADAYAGFKQMAAGLI